MLHSFSDLDRITDEVHALFDVWAEEGRFDGALQPVGVDVLRLAVHEWVANLVQHAAFTGDVEVVLDVEVDGDAVRCSLEDSSAGFDFSSQIERQQALLDAPAPSERGRGLLMLVTCTEDLGFQQVAPDRRQRISFVVRDPGDDVFASLFEMADSNAPADGSDDPTGAPPSDLE